MEEEEEGKIPYALCTGKQEVPLGVVNSLKGP